MKPIQLALGQDSFLLETPNYESENQKSFAYDYQIERAESKRELNHILKHSIYDIEKSSLEEKNEAFLKHISFLEERLSKAVKQNKLTQVKILTNLIKQNKEKLI